MPPLAAPVDPDLAQVEQDAVVEVPLVDVGPDLLLVSCQLLRGALGVEHEPVGHQVVGREVGLQATAPELGEVGVVGKAEEILQEVGEQWLGEHLLVLSGALPAEVFAGASCAVQLSVTACGAVEHVAQPRPERVRHEAFTRSLRRGVVMRPQRRLGSRR